jgi:hypothetical protein
MHGIVAVTVTVDLVEANPSARRVPLDEAKRYGASVNAMVVEASAKSGDSIAHTFEQVVQLYFERADASARSRQSAQGAPAATSKGAQVDRGNAAPAGKSGKCCS